MKTLLLSLLLLGSLNAKDVILDTSTNLLWQDAAENKSLSITYKESQEYCAKLVIAEYSDFRIPTLQELQSIIDYNNYKPAIINGFNYAPNETYWSSTPSAKDNAFLWNINFTKGHSSTSAKYYDRHIRCVQKVK